MFQNVLFSMQTIINNKHKKLWNTKKVKMEGTLRRGKSDDVKRFPKHFVTIYDFNLHIWENFSN